MVYCFWAREQEQLRKSSVGPFAAAAVYSMNLTKQGYLVTVATTACKSGWTLGSREGCSRFGLPANTVALTLLLSLVWRTGVDGTPHSHISSSIGHCVIRNICN